MGRPFIKMNGLGNDFVVVEAKSEPFRPTAMQVRAIADRAGGVGCDQLVALDPSDRADVFMRIWNADGGEVGACGNAARCVGWLMLEATGRQEARIDTASGVLVATRSGGTSVTVDMGEPGLGWRDIPLARAVSTREVPLRVLSASMRLPGCVSMGNPHVVFFVSDAGAVRADRIGPKIERHSLFPDRVNVGFAQIRAQDRIRLRVWERGVGLTKACGTGACAALVAAHRRGLVGLAATVEMDGGELLVEWRGANNHVFLTGPTAVEFTGRLPDLESAP
jgi:diaminopimelate epimerase